MVHHPHRISHISRFKFFSNPEQASFPLYTRNDLAVFIHLFTCITPKRADSGNSTTPVKFCRNNRSFKYCKYSPVCYNGMFNCIIVYWLDYSQFLGYGTYYHGSPNSPCIKFRHIHRANTDWHLRHTSWRRGKPKLK